MDVEAGLRRVPHPGPPPDGDPVLAARIRDEILARGPMTFARYMELALYDPGHGYYRGEQARPGREGDFLTAPEIHPVFGHALARSVAQMWDLLGRPDPFTIREYGAGSGALALALLTGLRADGSPLADAIRYQPVEIGERRLVELSEHLAAAGFGSALDPASAPLVGGAVGDGPPAGAPPAGGAIAGGEVAGVQLAGGTIAAGCLIANEFLDALPVHRVQVRDGELREVYVGWRPEGGPSPAPGVAGAFVELAGPPSTPALGERLAREGVELVEGQRAEVCLALDTWVAGASSSLLRGYGLVIDYGHPAAELYGPKRREGTLRTYARQTVAADPYVRVGRQDITAHVDVTALADAARRAGFEVLGITTQSEFLVGAGLPDIVSAVQSDPATSLADYLALRASLARLLDPAATGGFRVIVLGRDVPRDRELDALTFRLRR